MSEARPEDTVREALPRIPTSAMVDDPVYGQVEYVYGKDAFRRDKIDAAHAALDALVAERDTLRGLLERAADALHDAAWVIREDPHQPPLPPARTYVLPQTEDVEAGIRTALAAAGESDTTGGHARGR